MKIAFFGLPLAALLLHHDGHTIVRASLCRPRCIGERRLRRALGDRVDVLPDVERPGFVRELGEPDLVVSWFWTRRLPVPVIRAAPLGAIGVHPSLLPRHRGPDPYFWTIDAGDEVAGVTAHVLDEAYDTGPILAQRRIPIDPTWTAWRLAKRLDRPSLALLREVVAAYAGGKGPPPRPQDEALATEAPAPTDELLEIDWTQPAARIVRRVRAASPVPGAFTFLGNTSVTITRAEEHVLPPGIARALAPGEATVDEALLPSSNFPHAGACAVVRAGEGAVRLLAGVVESDREEPRELAQADLARLVRGLLASS